MGACFFAGGFGKRKADLRQLIQRRGGWHIPAIVTQNSLGAILRKMLNRKIALCLFAACGVAAAAKRPLTHQDYDAWRSILNPAVSNDGHYLAYGLFPQEGDGEVVVRDLKTGKEWKVSGGALPPPPAPDPNNEDGPPPQRNVRLAFTADSKALVFLAYPAKAETDQAKKDKKKAEEMPKTSLVTVDLASGAADRVADVKSFGLPD